MLVAVAPPLAAQQWNDSSTRRLVDRAIRERSVVTLDSSLRSYAARAHGILTFHAEFDDGLVPGPRLVKGDELDVEVYWERPDRSKQVIRAWRDSTFFPTDLAYHRDHLGIVSNDFGARIRIGDGDEVADVVHPLAPDGPDWYDYRIRDTLRITSAGRRLVLAGLDVRPRDPSRAGVAGTLYLDLDRAQVVRFRFTFTASTYRDRNIEELTVRLDRSLIDDRYWLPYRQEIEIRRRSLTVDFPVHGVIRGRWDIGDYRINAALPMPGPGSWIGGLRAPGGPAWTEPLMARLDSTLTPAETGGMAQIRSAARALVGRHLRVRQGWRPGVSRASDVLRWNRVEGLRLGAGIVGHGFGLDRVSLGAGIASGDGRLTGRVDLARVLGRVTVDAEASRLVGDVDDWPAASTPVNTMAAAFGGRDLGDYVLLDRVAVTAAMVTAGGVTVRAEMAREHPRSIAVSASPLSGRVRDNPALGSGAYWVGRLGTALGPAGAGLGWTVAVGGELGAGPTTYARLGGRIAWTRPTGNGEWRVEGRGGLSAGGLPARRAFLLGGAGTLPGEPFRSAAGGGLLLARVGRLWSVPGPSVGLGIFGRTAPTMQLGPFAAVGRTFGPVAPWAAGSGWRPVAGLAAEFFDRLIHVEVGRGFRGGSVTTVSVDLDRRWWPIL